MRNSVDKKQLRSFGFIVGAVFGAIGLWPALTSGTGPRWWAIVIASGLIIPAALFPASLAHPYKGWMWVGHVLGWINTRVILGFIFYFVVTPIGIFRRSIGKDPMGRKLRPDLQTYRVSCRPRSASHLTRQY
jgi:hypothetical protein